MNELFSIYSSKVVRGGNATKLFSRFFNNDRAPIEKWLGEFMSNLITKNNSMADKLRIKGNELYKRKKFKECFETYTIALCTAEYETELYSIILSNKSALLFMMQDYKNCLQDIKYCMECDSCPGRIKLKLHIRKIKCLAHLNKQEELNVAVVDALTFLESFETEDKNDIRKEILTSSIETHPKTHSELSKKLPEFKDEVNPNFLYASSAIKLSYDKDRGRHVVANKRIESGNVLFVEKPFIFAPVFINEEKRLMPNKCCNCLKTISSCLPCKNCTVCVFCNEQCREQSWETFHKWECLGMQAGLWYHIGITFPALRALVKGASSQFKTLDLDYEADTVNFGDELNNYPYFNKLISNLSNMKNVLPLIISATVAVLYLKRYTEFFNWLKGVIPEKTEDELIELVGGLLTRHIAQFQCNASTIVHLNCTISDNDDEVTDAVASAIYPSISMMNHSCKPNIIIEYVQDLAIAKATETIEADEEVFNCYGIDHRFDDFATRQEHLETLYYFKCCCRACKVSL